MKRTSTVFLQVVIVLIGIGTLALLLWEPRIEGRNVNSTNFEIYFKDAFLAYVYLGSVSFFIVLLNAFKLLSYIRQDRIFSQNSVRALRTIKYCTIILVAFILGAEAYLFIVQSKREDVAGGVAMGLILLFISVVIGAAATVFERILQNALDIKSENDLTI
jgi:hypothetical protein